MQPLTQPTKIIRYIVKLAPMNGSGVAMPECPEGTVVAWGGDDIPPGWALISSLPTSSPSP